jgi:hypothetical protein
MTMTRKEIFDTVKNHLLTQGKQSVRPPTEKEKLDGITQPMCVYRSEDGCSCAVGCLIPDDPRIPEIEGIGVWLLMERFPPLARIESLKIFKELLIKGDIDVTDGNTLELLRTLQGIHDRMLPDSWADELEALETQVKA